MADRSPRQGADGSGDGLAGLSDGDVGCGGLGWGELGGVVIEMEMEMKMKMRRYRIGQDQKEKLWSG